MEWYYLAVLGLSLAYDQRRVLVVENKTQAYLGPYPDLFSFLARFCGGAVIAMLIAGFFVGRWWWPLVAMALGTFTNLYGRIAIPDDWRWLASFTAAAVGIGGSVVVVLSF